jgi:AraC-like DNA-binding protein
MKFGDEYCAQLPLDCDPDQMSIADLGTLFLNARLISRFDETADGAFYHDKKHQLGRSICNRVDDHSLIEVNDSFLRSPVVIRNEVADIISFQFVASVKRAEFLGENRNVHNLGPAIIVSIIPGHEITYRVPRTHETIRHVVVATTFSNLLQRVKQSPADYPEWFRKLLDGTDTKPHQRVLFLEETHRDLTWPFFHIPVADELLSLWMAAKFQELLCIGLQLIKDKQSYGESNVVKNPIPQEDKIQLALTILNREYVSPPTLPVLARRLGISETQLKCGFKSVTGSTVMQYCIARRMEAARLLLDENRLSIADIADLVGYEDHSAFTRAFRRLSGSTPKQWRLSRDRTKYGPTVSA